LTDVNLLLVLVGRRAHALLDLPGHRQEGLLDVGCVLGGSFEEGDTEAVREFLQIRTVTVSRVRLVDAVPERLHRG